MGKPIVAIKSGRSEAGKSAALTHTGSLAGDYAVYEAAMKQCGVILVDTLEELIDIAEALSWQPKCNNGIAILTNGGGLGVLASDYFEELGISIAKPNNETIDKIEKLIPGITSLSVLDVLGDALSDRYALGLELLLKQNDVNGVLVIETPQIMTEHDKNAKIIIGLHKKYPLKPIISCFLGGKSSQESMKYLEENGIPNYSDVKRAVRAFKSLIKK
jgi:acetyltransferase